MMPIISLMIKLRPLLTSYSTALEKWAEGNSLIKATFFFWRAGIRDQKSINGLLRSLLYQMLSEYPQFVQTLDPGMRKDR